MAGHQARPEARRDGEAPDRLGKAAVTASESRSANAALRRAHAAAAAFAIVERAAIAGERCPTNEGLCDALRVAGFVFAGGNELLSGLAREGHLEIRVAAQNWRIVQLLTGEHAGKMTAPAPGRPYPPGRAYIVIGPENGARPSGPPQAPDLPPPPVRRRKSRAGAERKPRAGAVDRARPIAPVSSWIEPPTRAMLMGRR